MFGKRILIVLLSVFSLAALSFAPAVAQSSACNTAATDTVSVVNLSGGPFSAIPTKDGCTIFVSMGPRLAVLQRTSGKVTLLREVQLKTGHAGMRLSHDGKVLVAADGVGVSLYDVTKLMVGDGTPLASARDTAAMGAPSAGAVYIGVSPDDRLIFVSDEGNAALTVYDFAKLRSGDTAALGRVPVGRAPVGLVFSPDGKYLYATSELAPEALNIPATCKAEAGGGPDTPPGYLSVIDVAKAAQNPGASVIANVQAGCDPVRVALSAKGDVAYVTVRGSHEIRAFDTRKLMSDAANAQMAVVPVGKAPVGIAVAGERIYVANSNRFATGSKSEWLSVIDARKIAQGEQAVLGHVPTGAFPREVFVMGDGKTLLVTNFNSNSMELIDIPRLTLVYFSQQVAAKKADDVAKEAAAKTQADRLKNQTQSPGTDAALRHFIDGMAKGQVDYDVLGPQLANAVRQQMPVTQAMFQKWGAVKSVAFTGVGPAGADIYVVEFENGKTTFRIAPLVDGRITGLIFQPAP
jgi:DNA-binding beta-propeller fold protein YncE